MTLLIDGFNLAFRSHFAFRNFLTSTGRPSGALYGFMTVLRSLKKRYADCHFVVAWDHEARRKKAAYTEYKANRPKFQIDEPIRDLKVLLGALNVSQVEAEGEEADDVIASFVAQTPGRIYVYTSDKDMLQLVEDGRVIVIKPKVSSAPEKAYDEEAVARDFGVHPKDVACFLAFRGDTVDNIPGVYRVPSKVLAVLVSKYHTPDGVYQGLPAENLTDFQRQQLETYRSQVVLNYELVRLRTDVQYDLRRGVSDHSILSLLLAKYEIKAFQPESLIDQFAQEASFQKRTAPALVSFSLFQEV